MLFDIYNFYNNKLDLTLDSFNKFLYQMKISKEYVTRRKFIELQMRYK